MRNARRPVLLIDDEAGIGSMLSVYLQRSGLALTWAGSGEEGLRLMEEEAFDLVLLDLILPEMSGLEVLDRINTKQPAPPVIVISGFGDGDQTAAEALQMGAAAVIAKPFDLAALDQAIHRLLNPVAG